MDQLSFGYPKMNIQVHPSLSVYLFGCLEGISLTAFEQSLGFLHRSRPNTVRWLLSCNERILIDTPYAVESSSEPSLLIFDLKLWCIDIFVLATRSGRMPSRAALFTSETMGLSS